MFKIYSITVVEVLAALLNLDALINKTPKIVVDFSVSIWSLISFPTS